MQRTADISLGTTSRPSRQLWRVAEAGALAIAAAATLAGCGGGTGAASTTNRPATSPFNPAPITTQDASNVATLSPASALTTVTLGNGFTYTLSATAITAQTSVTDYLGGAESAPPGKVLLATTVTIGNPLTDRPEPDIASTDNGSGVFQLAMPMAEASALGESCQADVSVPGCLLILTTIGAENPSPDNPVSPQIAAGASTQVTVYFGPVPTTVSPSSVTAYLYDPPMAPAKIATS